MATINFRDPSTSKFVEVEVSTVKANPESETPIEDNLFSIEINGKKFLVADNSKVEITQEEYQALVEAGQVKEGVVYYITDGKSSEASSIGYDNSKSGLKATTMQGAIDEMADILTNIIDLETSGDTF